MAERGIEVLGVDRLKKIPVSTEKQRVTNVSHAQILDWVRMLK